MPFALLNKIEDFPDNIQMRDAQIQGFRRLKIILPAQKKKKNILMEIRANTQVSWELPR